MTLSLRLATLTLVVGMLGVPITDLGSYGLLVATTLAVFTGQPMTDRLRWAAAVLLAALVVAAHAVWPAPRIEEGHNAFLPGPRVAETSGLPVDVVRVMSRQFDEEYPAEARCDDKTRGCWRPDRTAQADGFGFSADAVFDRPAYSRRVTVINFSDPAYLRLGFINERIYGWPDDWSDIKRFERDRRSLHLFDRYRLTFPLFVVYRFPSDFVGSTLCWRGTVLWEGRDGRFETLSAMDRQCRVIDPGDVGRRIFGISIKRDVRLSMKLEPNAGVLFRHAIDTALGIVGAMGIIFLLVRIDLRRIRLPAILVGLGIAAAMLVDPQFIGGFRPFDSGDDGLVYEGYGREIVRAVLSGDIIAALRGIEPVYYFTPGLRYVRALELFLFGDTALLYLSAILLCPILVFSLFRRFLQQRWALVLAMVFAGTPIGALFGSSLFQYAAWGSRGFADPFAFILLFGALVLIIPKHVDGPPQTAPRSLAAGLMLAAAVFCRPNLVLASGVMAAGAATIWAWERRWECAGAIVAGFAVLALSPLHNYVFGNALVLFSDNVNQPTTLLMSPLDYGKALVELVRLDFASGHVKAAIAQLGRWLSGPEGLLVMVPIHALAVATLVRIGFFGTGYGPWLRVLALAALLQHGIGACYVNFARYNLGTWLLTQMVAVAWLDREGFQLLRQRFPVLCKSWSGHHAVRRFAGMVDSFTVSLKPNKII